MQPFESNAHFCVSEKIKAWCCYAGWRLSIDLLGRPHDRIRLHLYKRPKTLTRNHQAFVKFAKKSANPVLVLVDKLCDRFG